MQFKKYFLIIISLIIVIIGGIMAGVTLLKDPMDQEYKYGVKLGSPKEFRMIFGYDSALYRTKGYERTAVLKFPSLGAWFGNNAWGWGGTATSIFEKNQLPDAMEVNWFSPFEDQLWVGNLELDKAFLRQLSHFEPTNLVTHWTSRMMQNFDFIINVAPGGFGALWISGAGDKYLLGEFQARKSEIDYWPFFIQVLGYRKNVPTREAFIKEHLERESEAFQQAYREGTLDLKGDRWRRKMTRYPWRLVGNEHYNIKKYFARYTNGEQYNSYKDGVNPFRAVHAPPYELFVFIEGTDEKKRYERVRVLLDEEVVVKAFEKVADLKSDLPIELQISFNYEINKVHIYLTQGDRREKIEFLKAYLEDI